MYEADDHSEMNSECKIRVAIVDDHPMVREGLRSFLQLAKDIQIVAEAANGEDAIEISINVPTDVLIMDLVLPGNLDGIAAIRQIISIQPTVRIIALTSFQDTDRTLSAIQAGAVSYLQKDIQPQELLATIRQVAQGRSVLDYSALELLRNSGTFRTAYPPLKPSSERGSHPETVETLTSREKEVIEALAKGLSNKEIASILQISEKTVKVHISHILGKLGVYDRTQALLTASRLGIIHIE